MSTMLYLVCASRGPYMFGKITCSWIASGLRVSRNSCILRQSKKTTLSKTSVTGVWCLPHRLYTRDKVPMKRFTPKHKKDKVSTDFTLIYRKYMNQKLLLMVYGISAVLGFLSTSMFFTVMFITERDTSKLVEIPWIGLSLKQSILSISLIGMIVMSLPLLMHFRLQRNEIVRIYYKADSEEFVAIVKNNFLKRRLEFTMKDVEPILIRKRPNPDNIIILGKSYTAFETDFANTEYVNLCLGYKYV